MDAILWQGNQLTLLDQTKLPLEERWLTYTDYRQVANAIKTMVVRGAPAIGIAAAYGYCLAAIAGEDLAAAKEVLSSSRPTAVNLFWALDRMEKTACSCRGDAQTLICEAKSIHAEDICMNRTIGKFGAEIVPNNARILTHCNAGALATGGYGTALGVIRAAHTAGKVSMVYADETRPLLQGARLTAYELSQDNIPTTLIADSMAAFLMQQGKVDVVLLGCDRMAANGDFANKIGTYSIAVNARHHNIPFFVVLPSSSIDFSVSQGSEIPIEDRSSIEMRSLYGVQTAPPNIPVYNPAFDVTPHNLVTGIITEKGVVYPPFFCGLKQLFG